MYNVGPRKERIGFLIQECCCGKREIREPSVHWSEAPSPANIWLEETKRVAGSSLFFFLSSGWLIPQVVYLLT